MKDHDWKRFRSLTERMGLKSQTASLSALLLILSHSAHAQDVYNFYFQKAPGPISVQQDGTTGQTVVPNAAETSSADSSGTGATSSVQTRASLPMAKVETLKRWMITIGSGSIADRQESYRMGSLGTQYYFNKYLGIQGNLMLANKSSFDSAIHPAPSTMDRLDVALGGVVTPIHTHLFGWDFLDISVLFGMMSTRKRDAWFEYPIEMEQFSHPSMRLSRQGDHDREFVPYYGAQIALNLSPSFSFVLNTRINKSRGSDRSQNTMNLAWRF